MVSHILIGVVLLGLTLFGLFVGGVAKYDFSKIPGLSSFLPKQEPANPNIEFNTTIIEPTNTSEPFDVGKHIEKFPLNALIDYLTAGARELFSWISELITNILAWILRKFWPEIEIPLWFGTLIFIFLIAFIVFKMWDQIWNLGHTVATFILIVATIIIVVAILLILLGLL